MIVLSLCIILYDIRNKIKKKYRNISQKFYILFYFSKNLESFIYT